MPLSIAAVEKATRPESRGPGHKACLVILPFHRAAMELQLPGRLPARLMTQSGPVEGIQIKAPIGPDGGIAQGAVVQRPTPIRKGDVVTSDRDSH
jgi:hypothetical protein